MTVFVRSGAWPRLSRYTLWALLVLPACRAGGAGGVAAEEHRAPGAPDGSIAAAAATVGPPAAARDPEPAHTQVRLGVDVLLARGGAPLLGKRVGLITNHTGIAAFTGAARAVPRNTIDVLHEHPGIELVALFSPEHGIRGTAEAGERVASGVDERTGLPIHSLYDVTTRPTAAMLRGVDVLVFDIQDIGSRYYTYVWTMAQALQTAAEHGLEFVVLDRPNPLGGELVQGNVLEPRHASFVGLYPVPMRHGLTAGELARMLTGELAHIDARLTVIPAEGWRRDQWFDDTGLPWHPPSPNMPDLESATHYPGTCLFEGTNLSVGRGTPRAFQQIGAPWLDGDELARRLNAARLPGVRFEAVRFRPANPGDLKFADTDVRGVRFITTERTAYDPTHAAVLALSEIRRMHPQQLRWHSAHFDRLAGTTRLRASIEGGVAPAAIVADWEQELEAFRRLRKAYLLY
jgi:uncharacterized protein YbbC (DUF1343 family)